MESIKFKVPKKFYQIWTSRIQNTPTNQIHCPLVNYGVKKIQSVIKIKSNTFIVYKTWSRKIQNIVQLNQIHYPLIKYGPQELKIFKQIKYTAHY